MCITGIKDKVYNDVRRGHMQFRDLKQQYQVLKKDIDAAMVEVAANCNFINGQQVKDLEKELADYVGVKHCLGNREGRCGICS